VPSLIENRTLPSPGTYLCGLAWDGTNFWHSDQLAGTMYALDPVDGSVLRAFPCPGARADLTYGEGLLYQIGERPKRLLVIDPATGELVGRKPIKPSNGLVCGVEWAPEGFWLCLRRPGRIQLRDVATMTIQQEFLVDGSPSGLTVAGRTVYYSDFEGQNLRGYDTVSGEQVFYADVPGRPTGMTYDESDIWYADFPAKLFRAFTPVPAPRRTADV
jgi:hypothetical protein